MKFFLLSFLLCLFVSIQVTKVQAVNRNRYYNTMAAAESNCPRSNIKRINYTGQCLGFAAENTSHLQPVQCNGSAYECRQ